MEAKITVVACRHVAFDTTRPWTAEPDVVVAALREAADRAEQAADRLKDRFGDDVKVRASVGYQRITLYVTANLDGEGEENMDGQDRDGG